MLKHLRRKASSHEMQQKPEESPSRQQEIPFFCPNKKGFNFLAIYELNLNLIIVKLSKPQKRNAHKFLIGPSCFEKNQMHREIA
jgi:hypothetical protein